MTKITDMLFTLLRLSLNIDKDKGGYDLSAFFHANNEDWEQLFKLSVRQGVLLLSYGGLQYLPAELQPPHKLKLRWCVNVVKGSERYDHYKCTIARLSNLLSKNKIDLLVIKGITISELYPTPYFRESGDIDIYQSEKTEQVNDLISSFATRKEGGISKHSTFIMDGVLIENHYTFFDTTLQFQKEGLLYQKMENILNGMFSDEACPPIKVGNICKLHPQMAALYLIGHTFRHFCCLDINIRQMCDWSIFFTRNQKDIDADLLSSQIDELGLGKFVYHINSFCATYLGFEPFFMISEKNDLKGEQFIMEIIMNYRAVSKAHIPVLDVLCYFLRRNNIYKKYLGKVSISEFLLPEIKDYFIYLLRYRWRSEKQMAKEQV